MQKTTLSALSALVFALAMTESSQTLAQDQEEGAVEIDGPSAPAESAPATTEQPVSTPVETPPDHEPDEPSARASGEAGPWRVYVGARVGMGGGIKFEDADVAWLTRVTPGFAVGGDYVLHRYFAIGAETRFDFASVEPAKFMFWSLMAKPRGRLQLKQLPLELYAAVPVGLSISNAKNENQTGKASAMLGIAAGANYFFNAHWALGAELGWTWHWLRFEQPGTIPGQPTTVLYTARYGQMALAVNVLYAF